MKKTIVFVNDDKITYSVIYGKDTSIFTKKNVNQLDYMSKDEAIGGAKAVLQTLPKVYYAAVIKESWDFSEDGEFIEVVDSECIWEAWATDDKREKELKKKLWN